MHGAMLGQWRREMVHVANVVGGVARINLYYGDADRRYFPIDAAKQREALRFLNENAFVTPEMFLDPDVTGRIGATGAADVVLRAQQAVLNALIDANRVKRMSEQVQADPGGAYSPTAMLTDLTSGVWSELDDSSTIDLYRRNLQRAHVKTLVSRLSSADVASDMPALARGELASLRDRIEAALEGGPDETTARHLREVAAEIDRNLEQVQLVEKPADPSRNNRRRIEF
jgi:hypothetical protein